jgi:hypothetical protein
MGEPFDVCWDRMARAETHREAIAKVWAAFLDEDGYVPHAFVRDDGTGFV